MGFNIQLTIYWFDRVILYQTTPTGDRLDSLCSNKRRKLRMDALQVHSTYAIVPLFVNFTSSYATNPSY